LNTKKQPLSSDIAIKNISLPSTGRLEMPVKGCGGLMLRASSRGKTFYLKVRPPGERHPVAIKLGVYGSGDRALTLKQAKAKAEQWKEDIRGGIDPRNKTRNAQQSKYIDIVQEFLERGKTTKGELWKPKTAKDYRTALLSPKLKKIHMLPVATITEDQIQDVINLLESEGKYTASRRYLSYLKTFFAWCRKKKQGYIPSNQALPTEGVELENASDNARERYLSPEEIKVFWQATMQLPYPWQHYYKLALLTGQRMGNVATIKRSDVENNIWIQKENKANRLNLIPLNNLAQAVLADCPEYCDSYLTSTGDSPIQQSSKAKKKLDDQIKIIAEQNNLKGIFEESWVNHDLRRTITTSLRKIGINRSTCSAILNHAEQGVTAKNYDQYDLLDEKTQAMQAWNNYLNELIHGKSQKIINLALHR